MFRVRHQHSSGSKHMLGNIRRKIVGMENILNSWKVEALRLSEGNLKLLYQAFQVGDIGNGKENVVIQKRIFKYKHDHGNFHFNGEHYFLSINIFDLTIHMMSEIPLHNIHTLFSLKNMNWQQKLWFVFFPRHLTWLKLSHPLIARDRFQFS